MTLFNMDKDEFVAALLSDHAMKTAFDQAFDDWWRLATTEKRDGCLFVTKKPGRGYYLSAKDDGEQQLDIAAWWKKHMHEWGTVKISEGGIKKKKKKRVAFAQILLVRYRPKHLRNRFYSKKLDDNGEPFASSFFTKGGRTGYDSSHLCHNSGCVNRKCIVADPFWVNRETRKGCRGEKHCDCWKKDKRRISERRRCRKPGPNFRDWNSQRG